MGKTIYKKLAIVFAMVLILNFGANAFAINDELPEVETIVEEDEEFISEELDSEVVEETNSEFIEEETLVETEVAEEADSETKEEINDEKSEENLENEESTEEEDLEETEDLGKEVKLSHEDAVIFAKWSEPYSWVSTLTDGDTTTNKWSDWKRVNTLSQNWLSVVFGSTTDIREAKVNSVSLYIHTDGGINLPKNYEIQYYVGDEITNLPEQYGYAEESSLNDDSNWATVNYTNKPDEKMGGISVEFEQIQTKAIRVLMDAKPNFSLGLKELEVYGHKIDNSPVQYEKSVEEVKEEIKSLENLDEASKNDFLVRIGSQTNDSLIEDAKKADEIIAYYEDMEAPEKVELPPLEGPIYGGWFRTWHDKYLNPLDRRPNSFGEIPEEVDLAFVFTDVAKPYSEFWKVLTEEYVPAMNARGQRVLKTITVRETYMDVDGRSFDSTPEGIRERAEYLVEKHVTKHGLDGMDIDIEYHDTYYSSHFDDEDEKVSIETMKEISRILKEQNKIFMIDTNMNASRNILVQIYPYAEYVMLQAYGRNSLESDWNDFKTYIEPEKFILGFSFYEEGDRNGWNDISDVVEGSRAEKYALWQPEDGRKAGIVGYAIDRDGVAMWDDEIYHTDYSLSKELKQLMILDHQRDNAVILVSENEDLDETTRSQAIEKLEALRPDSLDEILNILEELSIEASSEDLLKPFGSENTDEPSNQVKAPIYGGYFRTWHDKSAIPGETRPNSFGDVPPEVDIVYVFPANMPKDTKFWESLKDDYVPHLQAQGQKVIHTFGIDGFMYEMKERGYANNQEGYDAYAKYLYEEKVSKYNLDGLDIDYEATGLFGEDFERAVGTFKALSKYMGPNSGTDKLLILDTNKRRLDSFIKAVADYVDFINLQIYGGNTEELDAVTKEYEEIVTPDKLHMGISFFEEYGQAWGDTQGSPETSTGGKYAKWQPEGATKGGMFAYAIDRDGKQFGDNSITETDYSWSIRYKQMMLEDPYYDELSLADRNYPQLNWDLGVLLNSELKQEDLIANKDRLPQDAKFEFTSQPDLSSLGQKVVEITVTYSDDSQDVLPARYVVKEDLTEPEEPIIPVEKVNPPLLGGYFRTWHDKNVEEAKPNSLGDVVPEVDLVYIFPDYTPDDSEFWNVLKEDYVPRLHAQGQKVILTYGVDTMIRDMKEMGYSNDETSYKEFAKFIFDEKIDKFNLDGIDLDYETDLGEDYQIAVGVTKELISLLGEDKLFILDTNKRNLDNYIQSIGRDVDLLNLQVYGDMPRRLTYYFAAYNSVIPSEKINVGFSFYEENGHDWKDTEGSLETSRAGQYAKWQPQDGLKAGIFGYAIDRDGKQSGDNSITKTDYENSISYKNLMLQDPAYDNLSMADKYYPQLDWDKQVEENSQLEASDLILNKDRLPEDAEYSLVDEIDFNTLGKQTVNIKVIYSDGSEDILPARIVVIESEEEPTTPEEPEVDPEEPEDPTVDSEDSEDSENPTVDPEDPKDPTVDPENPKDDTEDVSKEDGKKPSEQITTVTITQQNSKNPKTADPGIAIYGMITLIASGAYVFTNKKTK